MTPSSTQTHPDRATVVAGRDAQPPFWWPLVAGAPIALSLAVMALPELEHRHALIFRAFYFALFLAWTLPLTWLQRRLWARGTRWWTLCGVVLVVTYVMSMLNNAFGRVLDSALGQPAADTRWVDFLDGIDSCWLSLIAFAAVHAVVAHAYELRSERERLARAMAATRDAELTALRYQLQPHFLFNTLNAVSALIAEARNAEAQAMVARLGDFLRTTLDGCAAHEVALAEELASAEGYLDIERARLGPRLQVKWRIGADVLRAQVPTLLLQPLIENAIRHGIAPRTTPGRLDIAIDREGADLRIVIGNDIPGPASSGAAHTRDDGRERIGLRNLEERLRALYPGAYRLQAGRTGDDRFAVEVALPFRTADATGGAGG